jgi:urease gamma subunit
MIRIVFTILMVVSIGCSSADTCLKDLTKENFSVSISKGACLGLCPVYTGTVTGDGRVAFIGRANVIMEGAHEGTITSELLCRIRTALDENDVMSLASDLTKPIDDAPTTTIKITYADRSHTITWNLGVPKELAALQDAMVEATIDNPTLQQVP